jgi:hypothetical protein
MFVRNVLHRHTMSNCVRLMTKSQKNDFFNDFVLFGLPKSPITCEKDPCELRVPSPPFATTKSQVRQRQPSSNGVVTLYW